MSIIEKIKSFYNPFSSEAIVAKASSPVVEERLYPTQGAERAVVHNDQEGRARLTKANENAAKGASIGAMLVAAPQVAPHVLKVMANPMAAKTGVGAATAATADVVGTVYGVKRNAELIDKWTSGNFDWKDPAEFGLNLIPGYWLSKGLKTSVDMIERINNFLKLKSSTITKKLVANNMDYTPILNRQSKNDVDGVNTMKYYLALPDIAPPSVGAYDDVLSSVYSQDWYINRLRNLGMSEEEIIDTFNRYAKNLENIEWKTGPSHTMDNVRGRSLSFEGEPDGPKLIWINENVSKVENPYVRNHEALHMSTLGGSDMHPKIRQNNILYWIPTDNPQLRGFDEQRVRLLRFAKYAEDNFAGDYEAAAEHILEGWLNPRYQTPGRDVEHMFEHLDKDAIVKAAKHILGVSTPVGITMVVSSQNQQNPFKNETRK